MSLFAAFWSLPAAVLLAGYLVRFVGAVGAGEPPPGFHRSGGLLADGLRALALWAVYAVAPLALLAAWHSAVDLDGRLLTALSMIPGLGLGAWYLGRDGFDALSTVGSTTAAGPLPVAFGVVALLSLFLFPAALVILARERRLPAGVDPRALVVAVRRPGYPAAWVRAVALLGTGSALSLAWNWWRLAQPGADTEALVEVGGVTLVALPTGVGIASSLALLLVSAVGVLLLFRAYAGIAVAVGWPDDDD